jgi:hypothetical protein
MGWERDALFGLDVSLEGGKVPKLRFCVSTAGSTSSRRSRSCLLLVGCVAISTIKLPLDLMYVNAKSHVTES